MSVVVEIAVPCNCAELIGHEFEHLVEQIEGINLEDLAQRKGTGVSVSENGSFETERAQNAGRAIADEFDESRPRNVGLPKQ
jgi:hypothetical protein